MWLFFLNVLDIFTHLFIYFVLFQIYESTTLFHKNSALFSIILYINHQ